MPRLHEVPEVAQLTLDEAGDSARVSEVSEAGGVPFLKVANGADRPLPLLDGEELIGAKQNRIRNTTVLVAARTEVTIPVSCVEQGRWGYRGRQFRSGDASLYASRRARKAAHVSQSVRAGQGHRADQGEVWAHLADRASQLRVDSVTGAMRGVYARHQTDLTAAGQARAVKPGQIGALSPVSAQAMWLTPLGGSPSPGSGWTPGPKGWPRARRSLRRRWPSGGPGTDSTRTQGRFCSCGTELVSVWKKGKSVPVLAPR